MDPSPMPSPAPRTSFATVLAFLGLVAMAAGWFLPWVARLDADGFGFTDAELRRLEAQDRRDGAAGDVAAVVGRIRANGHVTGRDLGALGAAMIADHRASLTPSDARGWDLGVAFLRWAPWLAAGVAVLLLIGRFRKPGVLVGTATLVVTIAIGALLAILWLGASNTAHDTVTRDPSVLGVGMWAIHAGVAAALVGGLFAVRASTWWKVYLLTLGIVAAAVAGLVAYVKAA